VPTRTRRGLLYTSAAVLSVTLAVFWLSAQPYTLSVAETSAPEISRAETPDIDNLSADELVVFAQRDPAAFIEQARERYVTEVRAYRATMTKQELVQGDLTAVQQIDMRLREAPKTVYLQWEKNADAAKRVLFRDHPDFVDERGKLALVEPNGLARLVVSEIMMPIEGPRAERASRHSIEFAGFGAFFKLLEKYNRLAIEHGVLDLRFAGTGEVDGRPTIIVERRLPYTGDDGVFPDALLVMHFDRETLLPIAVRSYGDESRQTLFGEYVYTNIELNPDFGPDAFRF
jgi:hypothetical protein